MDKTEKFHVNLHKGCNCSNCGYGMSFKESVVCGVWHIGFSLNSLCDEYKTVAQVKAVHKRQIKKLLSDPNSFISRFKKQKEQP